MGLPRAKVAAATVAKKEKKFAQRERAAERKRLKKIRDAILPKAETFIRKHKLQKEISDGIQNAIANRERSYDWYSEGFEGEDWHTELGADHPKIAPIVLACELVAKRLDLKGKEYKVEISAAVNWHYESVPLGNNGDGEFRSGPPTTTVCMEISW